MAVKTRIGASFIKTSQFAADYIANADRQTCAIIGPSHKGPAFVPVPIFRIGTERTVLPNDNLGSLDRTFGDSTGSVNIQYDSIQGARAWLSGDNKQVSFIRVLGAGNGKKENSKGIVEKAGFVVGEEQVSGTSRHGKKSSNKYANEGGVPGGVYFLGGFFYEHTGSVANAGHPSANIFEQLGIEGRDLKGSGADQISDSVRADNVYPIITGILMTPSGVVPSLATGSLDDEVPAFDHIAKGFFGAGGDEGGSIGSGSIEGGNLIYKLLLNGLTGSNSAGDKTAIKFQYIKDRNYYFKNNVFNTNPTKIEEKGHYVYSLYDPKESLYNGVKPIDSGFGAFILSSSLGRNSSNANHPNYEDFRVRYRKASSPWVISQTYSSQNQNRNDLLDKVQDLFKIYSRTDGDVGNKNVYIVIKPHVLGSPLEVNEVGSEADWSTFHIYIVDYNDDTLLETFENCNLNSNSERYVANIIGTQNTYYNWNVPEDKQKVVTKGSYVNRSQYIFLEMSDQVEKGLINKSTMPCGFRGYRHLVTETSDDNTLLSQISNVENLSSNVLTGSIPTPVPMTNQLSKSSLSDGVAIDRLFSDNNILDKLIWGIRNNNITTVQFADPRDRGLDEFFTVSDDNNLFFTRKVRSKIDFDWSNYLPDAIQDGLAASYEGSSTDSKLDSDKYLNSCFHLEKILVHTGSGEVTNKISWNTAVYRRDGKNTDIISTPYYGSSNARYFNIEEDLNVFSGSVRNRDYVTRRDHNRNHLAFKIALAGGFDGVNIFDRDKLHLSSEACVREENDENEDLDLNGPTLESYKKASNLIADEDLLFRDMVCIPGMESFTIRKSAANLASDEKTYLYVQDVPMSNHTYEILTGSITRFLELEASGNLETFSIHEKTADMHNREYFASSFNASYFGKTSMSFNSGLSDSTTRLVSPTVHALNTLTNTEVGKSPSGLRTSLYTSDTVSLISTDLRTTSPNNDKLREKFKSEDINVLAPEEYGVIRILSARTEDDSKPSLDSSIGTRIARSQIRKDIRNMTVTNFLFENYTLSKDQFVNNYNIAVRNILQNYLTLGVLSSYETNIDSRNISDEDVRNGIFKGSVTLVFSGRGDIGSGAETVEDLSSIVGTISRIVN